jgi:hypothetical protein
MERVVDVRPRPHRQQVVVDAREEDVVRPVAEEVSGNRPTDRRNENQEDDEEAARHRDLVAPQADPDLLPVALCAYRLGAFTEPGPGLDADRCREPCL